MAAVPKHLDDLESERQDNAELEGKDYSPILDPDYRWQKWAAPKVDGKLDCEQACNFDPVEG